MNIRLLHILLPITLFAYQVTNAADKQPSSPVMPTLTDLTPGIPIQFGTYGQPNTKKGSPTHEEELDDSGLPNERFSVMVSTEELHTLNKPVPQYCVMLTQEQLGNIGREVPVQKSYEDRCIEAQSNQEKHVFGLLSVLASTASHRANLEREKILTEQLENLNVRFKDISSHIPSELKLHLKNPKIYESVEQSMDLQCKIAFLENELQQLRNTNSSDDSQKKLSHLKGILVSTWDRLDTPITADPTLIKKETLEKRKRTNNPYATLTEQEINELILKDRFYWFLTHCSDENEINTLKEVFSKTAEMVLTECKSEPEIKTSSNTDDQIDPEAAAKLKAMRTVQKILYTETKVNFMQEALSTGDFAKIPQIIIAFKQMLRLLTSKFPEIDAATTLLEESSSKPSIKLIEDFILEEKEEKAPSEKKPTEQPGQSSSLIGGWFGLG